MLDVLNQLVDSEVVDISEGAEQNSAAFDWGRRGFPANAHFIVHLEEVSADTDLDPLKFVLQVSVDGGPTVWHDWAVIDLRGNGAASKKGPFSVPIGPADFRTEVRAADAMHLRVSVRYTDASGSDNFTYSAYIGSGNPYPHFSSAGVLHA